MAGQMRIDYFAHSEVWKFLEELPSVSLPLVPSSSQAPPGTSALTARAYLELWFRIHAEGLARRFMKEKRGAESGYDIPVSLANKVVAKVSLTTDSRQKGLLGSLASIFRNRPATQSVKVEFVEIAPRGNK